MFPWDKNEATTPQAKIPVASRPSGGGSGGSGGLARTVSAIVQDAYRREESIPAVWPPFARAL